MSALQARHFFDIPGAAESHPVHLGVGISPVALRDPHAQRAVDPASYTETPLRSLLWSLGTLVRRRRVHARKRDRFDASREILP